MSAGLVADLVLVALALLGGASGFRRGLVVGLASLVGLVGGAAAGAALAPTVLERLGGEPALAPLVGLLAVVLAAGLGQGLGTALGLVLRRRVPERGGRAADSALGALLSVAGLLVVAWFLGSLVVLTPFSSLAAAARGSAVLAAVDAAVPDGARTTFSSLRREVATAEFPQVFGRLGEPAVPDAAPPDPTLAASPAVRTAREGTVELRGVAAGCRRTVGGSGFVYAMERVMTNAHVVAGVQAPTVATADGRTLDATVVAFDPGRDLAVLAVPGLRLAPLPLTGEVVAGDDVAVLGFPAGGPFTASPGRVRGEISARGPDVFNERTVVRGVYAVRADVRPGGSGGPLLAGNGDVVGVVFAASTTEPDVGFAVTAQEAAPVAEAGRTATAAVGTGGCA